MLRILIDNEQRDGSYNLRQITSDITFRTSSIQLFPLDFIQIFVKDLGYIFLFAFDFAFSL